MDLKSILNDSHSPLETICSAVVDGLVVADINKNFIFWNDAARTILGAGPTELDPTEWAKHYHLYYMDRDEILAFEDLPMIKALNGEVYSDLRVKMKHHKKADASIISVNGKPIYSEGEIVGALTTFRDITEHIKTETKLFKERLFYQRILDLMPGTVLIKDLEGKYLYGNKSFLELMGKNDVIGKTIEDVLKKETVDVIKIHDELVLSTKTAHDFEETVLVSGSKKMIFQTTRFPYLNLDGEIIGVCAVGKDITHETESKATLEAEKNKTAHISKLAAIGVLAAEIAHEIKNPLTIMKTNNDVIRYALNDKSIDHPFINQRLKVQDETIVRMDKVASSLSMLSKDASSAADGKFRVDEILEDVKSLISFRTKKMGIELDIQSTFSLHNPIEGNRVQLSEVILNLVINALDAVENEPSPRVGIRCEKIDHSFYMSVIDNGPGVPPELREKIFEPFFTTKDISKGTGLGLSIAKKIVDQHHGNLFYHQSDSAHAFVIKLPYKGEA